VYIGLDASLRLKARKALRSIHSWAWGLSLNVLADLNKAAEYELHLLYGNCHGPDGNCHTLQLNAPQRL